MVDLIVAISFVVLLMLVISYCCGDNYVTDNDGWPRDTTHKEKFISGAKWVSTGILVIGGGIASILSLYLVLLWALKTIAEDLLGAR